MIENVTRSLPKSVENKELTNNSLGDQETLTFTRLAVKKIAPRDIQPIRSPHPVGAHRRGTKLCLAQEVKDRCFRKHPESSLLGTGTLCPEQQREPTEICLAASPAHLRSQACHQKQGHAIQESHGGTVDPSRNAGSLETAVRPLSCHG